MRIAVVSDIHGNLGALEAVLADLTEVAPDLVAHGGDLADSGSSGAEVVDRVRERNWPGVMGNTEEMLVRPESLEAFAAQSAAPGSLWKAVREIASATREVLGAERLAWLGRLPTVLRLEGVGVVHASPASCWTAPAENASDGELEEAYGSMQEPVIVFGHTHKAALRVLGGRIFVNSGSVGLPYDGDPRASYAVVDDGVATLRRVEYDVEREIGRLRASRQPGAEWTERMLRTSRPQMP